MTRLLAIPSFVILVMFGGMSISWWHDLWRSLFDPKSMSYGDIGMTSVVFGMASITAGVFAAALVATIGFACGLAEDRAADKGDQP